MKKVQKILLYALTVAFVSLCMTSCDPDDVDAFAEGYRDGYNSTYYAD